MINPHAYPEPAWRAYCPECRHTIGYYPEKDLAQAAAKQHNWRKHSNED